MLPIFVGKDSSGHDLRGAHTYNGLTINDPTETLKDSTWLDSVVPVTALTNIVEQKPTGDGAEAYEVRKVGRIYRLDGKIRASTLAALYDRSEELSEAFDPAKLGHDHPGADFLAYDFSVPTADTATYSTGLIACRYYARSRVCVEPPETRYMGLARPFRIELFMADPRRYLQTASSLTGAGTADNTKADYRSWPTVTITASGAGSATYTLANSTTSKSIVLNLSTLVAADVVVVDMEHRKITKNGTETESLYVSGSWWEVEPGNNTVAITNGTNVTTVLSWRSAFCD